jgi:glutaminyl-peptide cyclotransferase
VIPTRGAVRSAALAGALFLGACGQRPPPAPEFNPDRAWSHLVRQLSFGPRYAESPGHRRQLAWMAEELEFRADTVIRQEFTATDSAGKTLRMTNLVARFRPELADRVLLVANWDTRRRADGSPEPLDRRLPVPGANLNASGVAVLMEMAQLFREEPPPVGIDLLLADGDDYSREVQMTGTRHFIRSMPGYRPRYAVVLQGVADVEARFPMDSASATSAAEPARRMWEAARRLRYDSVFAPRTAAAAPSQGLVLAAAGIPAVVVADREYGPLNARWHAVDDLPRYLSKETLRLVGRTLAAAVYAKAPAGEVR